MCSGVAGLETPVAEVGESGWGRQSPPVARHPAVLVFFASLATATRNQVWSKVEATDEKLPHRKQSLAGGRFWQDDWKIFATFLVLHQVVTLACHESS